MEQHPIPGAITTYKFKLVGDMTLKQFLELAAGVITAWIIFNSEMNFLFKFTLGPIAGLFGFALAFLPIEDRPLDQWIISFFKAIYSPTQFIFVPQTKKLDFFEPVKRANLSTPAHQTFAGQSGQLDEYLQSLPPSATSTFDQAESKYLEHISGLFSALGSKILPGAAASQVAPAPTKTNVKGVRVRQLSHPQMCLLPRAVVFQAPAETKQAAMPAFAKAPARQSPPPAQADSPSPRPQTMKPSPAQSTVAPTFVQDPLLPLRPEKPNLIAGITLDKNGKIIPDTILEIRDNQGFPVRALKANKLGQFFIATQLDDGIYEIHAEHADHKFAIIRLEAKNEIIPPLKIQAAD